MITPGEFAKAATVLPVLHDEQQPFVQEFMRVAIRMQLPAGRQVFGEGDKVEMIALLLSGAVRVYKIGENGREITLYRFGAGQSCVLSANAILSRQTFPALAVVEEVAEAILIPAANFRAWIERYELWREFVFAMLAQRLANLLAVVEEVAFRRMDARVAGLLLNRCQNGQVLAITHQKIAAELGTSREVISRILEDFATRGLIRSARGAIEVLNPDVLRATSGW